MSLQTAMVEMAHRLEALCREGGRPSAQHPTELEAFICIDAVLAGLYKQMMDAQANFNALKQKRGTDDPMTSVAADQVESADCAVQTRLIELRSDRDKQGEALRYIRRAKAEAESALQRLSAQTMLQRISISDDHNDDVALAFALMTIMKRMQGARPRHAKRLSMAHTFNALTEGTATA